MNDVTQETWNWTCEVNDYGLDNFPLPPAFEFAVYSTVEHDEHDDPIMTSLQVTKACVEECRQRIILAAAAPELFRALTEMVDDHRGPMTESLEAAQKALAKARGETK